MLITRFFFLLALLPLYSGIIFLSYSLVTVNKTILDLQSKILFLESQILIKEQEQVLINAQALDLTNQDTMVIKLILGCVITLFLCGTTYYFFS